MTRTKPQTIDDEDARDRRKSAPPIGEQLEKYLDRIAQLAKSVVASLTAELGVDLKAAGPDREAAQELIEENFEWRLTQEEGFHELVQDILEDVRSRLI